MSQQTKTLGETVDNHVIEEFIAEYRDAHREIESLLLALENEPDHSELLNSLFRQVHSIKGNSHFLGLEDIASFVHALENVLDKVRKREMNYDKLLGDVVLQAIDHIGYLCEAARSQQSINTSVTENIRIELSSLAGAPQHEVPYTLQKILGMLGKDTSIASDANGLQIISSASVNLTAQHLEDLKFYARIIESAEQRSPFWLGRSQRILNIALALNIEAGSKVDPTQLEAAVYLHDFGMAFLPLEILHKSEALTEQEIQTIRLHPSMAAAMLSDNPFWQEATQIVLQHHEREDGLGYPHGLDGSQICDGARIIAIADTFDSMTNHRANRPARASVAQVINEINSNSGSQFSPFWVSIFNKVVRNKTRKS